MAGITPGYYKIGEYNSGDYSLKLYEWADGDEEVPAELELKVMDEVLITGKDNDPFATHLRGELQLQVLDKNNALRDRFKNRPSSDFYITSNDPDLKFVGYPVTSFIGGQFWKTYNLRTFVFGDGISTLRLQDNDYTDYIQLGDFFYQILNDIGVAADLNMIFDYQHNGASGQSDITPQQLRILPSDFVHPLDNPTKYDVLSAILEYFKLQIWQQDGDWWIVQRDVRGSIPTRYTRNSGGWTASALSAEIDIARSDLRGGETEDMEFEALSQFTREVEQQEHEFATINPQFEDWTGSEPDGWTGTGSVSEVAEGLRFNNILSVYQQSISRIVKAGDTIQLDLLVDYELKEGLATATELVAELFQISLFSWNLNGSTSYRYYNGSWTFTEVNIEDAFTLPPPPQEYIRSRTFGMSREITIPDTVPHGYLTIKLLLSGDDVYAASNPAIYKRAEATAIELADSDDTGKYTATVESPHMNNQVSDTVYPKDSSLYSVLASIKYYDGTNWQPAEYWGDGSINTVVMEKWLSQRSAIARGYQLQLRQALDVELSSLISLPDFDADRTFIPFLIQRYRKEKKLIVQMADLTKDDGIEVTFEVT